MYQTSILFEDYIAAVIHEEEIHIMSSSRRVVRHAVSGVAIGTVIGALIAARPSELQSGRHHQ